MRAFDYHIQQSSLMFIKAKSFIHMQSLKTEIEEKTKTKKKKTETQSKTPSKTKNKSFTSAKNITTLHYTNQNRTK
jgi:hypothetical protein